MAAEAYRHRAKQNPLGALLNDSLDEETVERIGRAVSERDRTRVAPPGDGRRRQLVVVALAATILLAFGIVFVRSFVLSRPSAPGPLTLSGGVSFHGVAAATTVDQPQLFTFDDGSAIRLWPGTEVTPRVNTGARIVLELSRGRAHFEIEPGGPRSWLIDLGLAQVEVVGTSFTIDHDGDRGVVSVSRGNVRVRSAFLENERHLTDGDSVLVVRTPVESDERVAALQEPAGAASEERADSTVASPRQGDESPAPPRAVSPSWRGFASRGRYDEAYEELGSGGIQQQSERAQTMDELIALADVARLSGHPRDAVEPLERALRTFRDDSRATVTAFTLGRVEADSLGHYDRAVRAFRTCLQLGPPAALEADTYARLAESYVALGRYDDARAVARQYLQRFPDGTRAAQMRRWIDDL